VPWWCSMSELPLKRLDEYLWEIPRGAISGMRVPARLFADAELLEAIEDDRSLEQLANMATLPGIVDFSLAMPDIHQGYGFPVGGVAATEEPDGVVSPGGVGYTRSLGACRSAQGGRVRARACGAQTSSACWRTDRRRFTRTWGLGPRRTCA